MRDFEYDDASSNPRAVDHLPVGGEVGSHEGNVAPDIIDDMVAGVDEESSW